MAILINIQCVQTKGKSSHDVLHLHSKRPETTQHALWMWWCHPGLCKAASGARPPAVIFISWGRHQMETFSALLAICAGKSPVAGEFPAQRPVTRSFDIFFDRSLNKRLSKQSWGWWFETPPRPLWRHCNVLINSSFVKTRFDGCIICLVTYNGYICGLLFLHMMSENLHIPGSVKYQLTHYLKAMSCVISAGPFS